MLRQKQHINQFQFADTRRSEKQGTEQSALIFVARSEQFESAYLGFGMVGRIEKRLVWQPISKEFSCQKNDSKFESSKLLPKLKFGIQIF